MRGTSIVRLGWQRCERRGGRIRPLGLASRLLDGPPRSCPAVSSAWQSLAGLNELKFMMGLFSLLETTGVTLLGPVLAALPKPLQRVRIGPLAATETYSARDWAITNALGFYFATVFYMVNYKFLMGTWGRELASQSAPPLPPFLHPPLPHPAQRRSGAAAQSQSTNSLPLGESVLSTERAFDVCTCRCPVACEALCSVVGAGRRLTD
jgi:hypothetical protein